MKAFGIVMTNEDVSLSKALWLRTDEEEVGALGGKFAFKKLPGGSLEETTAGRRRRAG